MTTLHHLRVWGNLACFTRPEMKVERVSYPVPTPSATRGILEAILYKPQFRWHVHRIAVRRPVQFLAFRRNEVKAVLSARTAAPILADEERTQRNTLALRDVEYVIEASLALTPLAGRARSRPPGQDESEAADNLGKYNGMFRRRTERGQCFAQPCFGCREFPAHFELADVSAMTVPPGINRDADLGLMVYDVWDLDALNPDKAAQLAPKAKATTPRVTVFRAALKDGVVAFPAWSEVRAQLAPDGRYCMILQALLAYGERDSLGDADFEPVGVRWQIPLTVEGRLSGRPIPLSDDPTAKKPPPKTLSRPFTSPNELTQTGEKARAYFLCDSLERATLFLDPRFPEKHENRHAQHRYFRGLLATAAKSEPTAASALNAVLTFLDNPSTLSALHADLTAAKAKPSENATFAVDGIDLLSVGSLRDFWRKRRRNEAKAAAENRAIRVCIATGDPAATLDTTEKIKGIPGGLAQGTNLISFDKSSFCSFGLEQAQNAPLSPPAELKIRTALNVLVQHSREQRLVFNETIYLHWTREPIEDDPLMLLSTADSDGVRHLLESVRGGNRQVGLDANLYYCLGLSGNGARIVVRDWLETTVDRVKRAIAAWFESSEIIDPDGVRLHSGHKFGAILYSMVRAELAELPPPLPAALFYAILRGASLPRTALAAALRRQSLDQRKPEDTRDPRLNPARLGLVRAVLNRLDNQNRTMTAQLDPACSDPAYLCGRLFAVFAELQPIALESVNAGVVERFYASASVTPSLVMGRLFRNAQNHLSKAEGRGGWRAGAASNIRKDFEDLTTRLGCEFPPTLTLEDQGRFALGFYHQKADYRRIGAERREERTAAGAASNLQ